MAAVCLDIVSLIAETSSAHVELISGKHFLCTLNTPCTLTDRLTDPTFMLHLETISALKANTFQLPMAWSYCCFFTIFTTFLGSKVGRVVAFKVRRQFSILPIYNDSRQYLHQPRHIRLFG
jgi:hypothetical protein